MFNQDFPDGTVMSWSTARWKLSQVEKEVFDPKDFCRKHVGRNLMMFPERVSLEKAEYHCERVGKYKKFLCEHIGKL